MAGSGDRQYAVAVMRFDDRNRYAMGGQQGIPATILFSGGQKVVVRMKEETVAKAGKRNRFAKVELIATPEAQFGEAQLVELLGLVGEARSRSRLHAQSRTILTPLVLTPPVARSTPRSWRRTSCTSGFARASTP